MDKALFASFSLCSSWSKSAPLMPLLLAWSNETLASINLSILINATIWLYQNCALLGLASKAVLKNGRASSILPNPTVSKPVLWFASGCLGRTLRIAAYRRCAFCDCPALWASTACCRAWSIVSFATAILNLFDHFLRVISIDAFKLQYSYFFNIFGRGRKWGCCQTK